MPRKRTKEKGLSLFSVVLGIILLSVFSIGMVKMLEVLNPPCANSISCIKNLSGKFEAAEEGIFLTNKIGAPSYLANIQIEPSVLGEQSGEKHIYVDLAKQRLFAYQGEEMVFEFPVSTGKWGWTPTGEFDIWIKLRHTRMEGGSGNDYYNLPNVPYTMFFYNKEIPKSRGYALHGAYWHNNFGYIMSHGCVNLRPEDAGKLYNWATPTASGNVTHASNDNPGTKITIFGESPS